MPKELLTIESVSAALTARPNCRGDLLAALPFNRRAALEFIKRNLPALEAATGRRLRVRASEYTPSGRGAFGRSKGGRRATRTTAAIFWT